MTATIRLEPQFTTGRVDNRAGGWLLSYEIQLARASDGVWHQRHIYFHDRSGELAEPHVEQWIVSTQSGPGAHMKPMDEELERELELADQKHNAMMLDGCETEDELNAELRWQSQ